MSKTIAYRMLISLLVGVLLEILFPQILVYEFKNNINYVSNVSEFKGSIYANGFWFPILIMILAGLLSETFIRLSRNYRKKWVFG